MGGTTGISWYAGWAAVRVKPHSSTCLEACWHRMEPCCNGCIAKLPLPLTEACGIFPCRLSSAGEEPCWSWHIFNRGQRQTT